MKNIQYTFVAISSGMALKHRLLHCACPAKGEVLCLQTRAEKNKHVGLEKRETTWVLFRMRVVGDCKTPFEIAFHWENDTMTVVLELVVGLFVNGHCGS